MNATRKAALAKAMAHPLRWRIMDTLGPITMSPSELAAGLEAPLGVVSYHVRELAKAGMLEMVREEPRRGAVEHYYRARRRPDIEAPPIIRSARKGIGHLLAERTA